jgi:ribosomal protein S18 acetylase RimI-like enzyme
MVRTLVRKAAKQDADAIVGLWLEKRALHAEIEPAIWTPSPEAEGIFRGNLGAMLRDSRCRVLVAARGPEIVGFLTVIKEEGSAVTSRRPYGSIGSICVAPSARRRGVGTRLLAKAMAWLKRQGVAEVEVSYATGNELSSSFWQAHGFRTYRAQAVRPVKAVGRRPRSRARD